LKSRDTLVKNLFGKRKRRNKCKGRKKGLREKEEIEYPKQRKSNIGNNITLY
jgi:hypothetical protein